MRSLVSIFLLVPAAAVAQHAPTPSAPRADVTVTVGWLHSALDDEAIVRWPGEGDWIHDRATIGAGLGVYWTGHAKTEVTVETSSGSRLWGNVPVNVDGQIAYRSAEHVVSDTRFSLGQYYQFGRNAWVHPSLGGGVTLARRTRTSEYYPVYLHDGTARPPSALLDYEKVGPVTDTTVSAFVAAAVKAYVTTRAFLRTDLQLDVRTGLDDVVVRAGFGFDF